MQHKNLYVRVASLFPKHSTQHQLFHVLEFLSEKLSIKIPAAAIFLDVAKAFDKVWQESLIYKLIRFKFSARLILLIYSYLWDRTFCVRMNNILSAIFLIIEGIFQESASGPLLFNMFFNDIPRSLHTYLALYAGEQIHIWFDPRPIQTIQVPTDTHRRFHGLLRPVARQYQWT